MKLTSLPVACLALAGTALAVPASSKAALANHDLRSTITVHESAATTTVYSTVYSTRKPAMSTEGCTPVTVTVTYSMHLLEGPTSTLRATPTHLPGSIMKHLDGLPSTYVSSIPVLPAATQERGWQLAPDSCHSETLLPRRRRERQGSLGLSSSEIHMAGYDLVPRWQVFAEQWWQVVCLLVGHQHRALCPHVLRRAQHGG